MRQQIKKYFLTSFLAVLFVGIGFWGYATAQTPVTEQQAKNKAAELAIKDMLSVRLPPNVLEEGQTYRWRVRVADGINWINVNNRSHNQWQGKQIISQNWVNQSTQAHIKAGGYDYGYQWWRGKT